MSGIYSKVCCTWQTRQQASIAPHFSNNVGRLVIARSILVCVCLFSLKMAPAHVPSTVRDSNPEWVLYHQSNYEYDAVESLDKDGPIEGVSKLRKRLETYHREGMRRSVVGVLLCHRHESPHVLLLQNKATQKCLLPSGKFKSWEKPKEVLASKLEKWITVERTKHTSQHSLINVETAETLLEVGEFLGEWWRVEFYSEPLPYLPPHVTRPKERLRLYQVTLPAKCVFKLPQQYILKAVPLFDTNVSNGYGVAISGIPHLLCRFHLHYMIEVDAPTTVGYRPLAVMGGATALETMGDNVPLAADSYDREEDTGTLESLNIGTTIHPIAHSYEASDEQTEDVENNDMKQEISLTEESETFNVYPSDPQGRHKEVDEILQGDYEESPFSA